MDLIQNKQIHRRPQWWTPRVAYCVAFCALVIYAFGILSLDLTSDWHHHHEDNGAMHTTFALSHLKLGLEKTRAHDLFFNPQNEISTAYGHHPPATALILAAVFSLTGSTSPWIARMVAILFHLGSIFLMVGLLRRFFAKRMALLGGFIMATLPMGAYFGRMVNYEPLCLFTILMQLAGYAAFKQKDSRGSLIWLSFGILLGGLIDWGSFFFAMAIAGAEIIDVLRKRSRSILPLAVTVISAIGIFSFDIWHLWYAGHGSLISFREVLSTNGPLNEQNFTLMKFVLNQLETFRRYYTHTGLLSVILALFCLIRSRKFLSKSFFDVSEAQLVKRLLAVTGIPALGYVLAAPSWAIAHHYWQFYFLPFVVISMLLVLQLLWRKFTENRAPLLRILLIFFVMEVIVGSAYMLHFRYTRIGSYAVKQTAVYRETFLSAKDLVDNVPKATIKK